jgi:chromosome segregation ATPase
MSAERSYTEEVRRFSAIVEQVEGKLDLITSSIERLSKDVADLKVDADNLTKGNQRHGIKGVRDEIKKLQSSLYQENTKQDAKIDTNKHEITRLKEKLALYGGGGGGVVYIVGKLLETIFG